MCWSSATKALQNGSLTDKLADLLVKFSKRIFSVVACINMLAGCSATERKSVAVEVNGQHFSTHSALSWSQVGRGLHAATLNRVSSVSGGNVNRNEATAQIALAEWNEAFRLAVVDGYQRRSESRATSVQRPDILAWNTQALGTMLFL